VPLFALLLGECSDLKNDIPIITTLSPVAIDGQMQYENLSIEDIMELNHGNVEITRDPATDIPKWIDGIFTTRTITSEEDAVLALLDVRGIFGIESSNFACVDIDDSREKLRAFIVSAKNPLAEKIVMIDALSGSVLADYPLAID
jgi:hypothetical protein